MKAIWNGELIAESDDTIVIDNNHYFPVDSIKSESYKPSETDTVCNWKVTAGYYTLDVNGQQNPDAAWYYAEASKMAKSFEGYVSVWKGMEVNK